MCSHPRTKKKNNKQIANKTMFSTETNKGKEKKGFGVVEGY